MTNNKYYLNFTESFFENAPNGSHIKARTCIECDTYAQVEELQRNATYQNWKYKSKLYKYMTVTRKPIKNAYMSSYEEFTKLHDNRN